MISLDNLILAWEEFIKGKRNKRDVQEFQQDLADNILELHLDLKKKTYKHGEYHTFNINDPKSRTISKASVRDRLLHHAIYRILYPIFDKKFITDSYSCRKNKGTHKALERFKYFSNKVSKNNTRTCWVLKCDIRKCFASIDHEILIKILRKHIIDDDVLTLLQNIITSFPKGLPLGNLTSQLLVNIYMNEFDQFVKHELQVKYYIRYADDFVFLSEDRNYLANVIHKINWYLNINLRLDLHPKKVFISTLGSGVDFLGWIHFQKYRVLRKTTKRRMLKRVSKEYSEESLQSYLGLISHGNTYKLQRRLHNIEILNK